MLVERQPVARIGDPVAGEGVMVRSEVDDVSAGG